MLVAAQNPLNHKLFIEFAVLGNIPHAVVRAVFSDKLIQFVVDVGFLGLMGVVLLVLYPGVSNTSYGNNNGNN